MSDECVRLEQCDAMEAQFAATVRERDELRAALQKIIDGTMDEYVERVARTALARREGNDDE